MGIDFKVNISRKITINGKEYASPEDVPEEFRRTVQDAMGSAGTIGTHSRITVNGVSYDGPDAMPQDVRRIYEHALEQAEARGESIDPRPAKLTFTTDLKPEGAVSWKTILVFLLAGAVLLILKLVH